MTRRKHQPLGLNQKWIGIDQKKKLGFQLFSEKFGQQNLSDLSIPKLLPNFINTCVEIYCNKEMKIILMQNIFTCTSAQLDLFLDLKSINHP